MSGYLKTEVLTLAKKSPKSDEGPLPSGAMYIGICNLRAQSVRLRWQKIVVLITINLAVAGLCVRFITHTDPVHLGLFALVALLSIILNRLGYGLAERSNQWIVYYTEKLNAIEESYGTESGVLIFSDREYISKRETEHLVRGIRFRRGVESIVGIMLWLWRAAFFITCIMLAYQLGVVL